LLCVHSPPEGIGQVERANIEILKGLKMHTCDGLKKHDKKWIDELLCALWGNRTSSNWATRETPFLLVYGVEAVLPLEITMGSLHVQTYDEAVQDRFWCDDIDLVDKGRRQSAIKNVWYW
jgi:hypothetical protein